MILLESRKKERIMKHLFFILLVFVAVAGLSIYNSENAQLSRINADFVNACTMDMASNPDLICD